MDEFDRKILTHLQMDSSRPIAVLAEEVGLSTSACHRRIRMLEDKGVIQGYRAELDMAELGLDLEVFVEISLSGQDVATLEAFDAAVIRHHEILDCWLTAGHSDYLLRLLAEDMNDYERLHRSVLARLPGVASMKSRFVLRRIGEKRGVRF